MRLTSMALGALLLAVPAFAQEATVGAITVEHGWARPAATGGNSAAYMVIANKGAAADRLVGAASAVARSVEFHTTSVDAQGVASMRPVQAIEIPAGGQARLAPGGLHVMLIGLARPLEEGGQDVPLTLTFEGAGAVELEVAVARQPSHGTGAGAEQGHGSN